MFYCSCFIVNTLLSLGVDSLCRGCESERNA